MNLTGNGNISPFNKTINGTINQTDEIMYEIGTASHITNVVITVLTVILNCAMIKLLQTNRSEIPEVIFQQLMSLCISDVIAGLTPATSCFTLIESVNRSSKACTAVLATFASAQYAVLLNVFLLSFRRWLVLRKVAQPTTRTDQNLLWTILCTLCSWLVSGLLTVSVISVAGTGKSTVSGCLSPDLFENLMAMKSVTATYTGTLVLLNIFNTISAMTLKRLNVQNTSVTNSNRRQVHQRAFRHLLYVLILTNVTTLPYIVLSAISAVQDEGPAVVYASSYFAALNSLINPILYTAHITEIRDALKARLLPLLERKRNVATRNEINENLGTERSVHITAT